MGKKLGFKEIKEKQSGLIETKAIKVKLGEEDYDANVVTSFKYSILDEMFKWLGANDKVMAIVDEEQVLGVLLMLKFLTDIDLGENIVEHLEAIVALSEAGVLGSILEHIDESVIGEYVEGMNKMTKDLEKGMEKLKVLRK
jgi:hypothetical protein